MTPTLPLDAVRRLADSLNQVKGRARAAVKRQFMSDYGCSASSLSRALHEVGFRSHVRGDRGQRRKPVADEQLLQLAALQRKSLSLRRGIVMPAEDAINIAEDSGLIERGAVSVSYYNAWLRRQEASRKLQTRPEPHTELRSLGPNHVHQVDFSLAVNWKVANNKLIYEHLVYKNKLPEAGAPRIWRLIVVDHASGVFFPFYAASAGESVPVLLEGLYRAWSEKKLRGESVKALYPFRGVPQILMADRGSANRAGITVAVLQKLGVTLNICEGARSKGAVEVSHDFWEEHFESRFRLEPPASIEQLNEWAVDFAIRICASKVHSRHGGYRSHIWNWHIGRKPETALRELRCDFETFRSICLSEPKTCRVSGSRIVSFKSKKYRVPEAFLPGESVDVQYSPFDYPAITVRAAGQAEAPAWVCQPVQVDEFGFSADAVTIGEQYRAQKQSPTARFVKQADEEAERLLKAGGLRVFGHHAGNVAAVPGDPPSAEVPIAAPAPRVHTRIQARLAVREIIGRDYTAAEAAHVNRRFGDQVTEDEIAAVVAEIQEGIAARVFAFPAGKEAAL
ncbi:MAG: hypothetical protein ACE15B_19355 [Bryobacteraceae bacterium]